MSFAIKTTTKTEEMAGFIASSVSNKLKSGKQVLLFLAGGSAIEAGVKIAEILKGNTDRNLIKNLAVTLTDERYGPINHPDSNWHQLIEKGFDLPEAKLIPVLIGENREETVKNFNINLNEELTKEGYKVGLFGIGADGHTAGILPGSIAVDSKDLVCGYDTPKFSRITITRKVIEKLDEAVVWAQGEDKWKVLEDLQADGDFKKQPAQILKKVPLLTIFSDYSN